MLGNESLYTDMKNKEVFLSIKNIYNTNKLHDTNDILYLQCACNNLFYANQFILNKNLRFLLILILLESKVKKIGSVHLVLIKLILRNTSTIVIPIILLLHLVTFVTRPIIK